MSKGNCAVAILSLLYSERKVQRLPFVGLQVFPSIAHKWGDFTHDNILLFIIVVVRSVVVVLSSGASHLLRFFPCFIDQLGTCNPQPLLMQGKERVPAVSGGKVGCTFGILQRCKFLVTKTLPDYKVIGKSKDIEDKLFHLYPIWFVRFDYDSISINIRNLLLCYVVLQGALIKHDHSLNKVKGEEVNADICSAIYQGSIPVPLF